MAVPIRRFSTLGAALVAAAVLLPAANGVSRANALPTLYVTYAMNCTFTITDDSGARVSSIPPGSYQIQISTPIVFADIDLTGVTDMTACKSFVQFSLTGPGVNLSTTLQEGDEDFGVLDATFQKGSTYIAQDNNQPAVARLTFTTQASGSPTAPPSASGSGTTGTSTGGSSGGSSAIGTDIKAEPLRGTLIGSVTSAGVLTLTSKGKGVATLKSGRYTVTVTDKSTRGGFTVQQSNKAANAVTGIPYVGTKTVTLTFKPGQWIAYPTIVGKKTYFIVTA